MQLNPIMTNDQLTKDLMAMNLTLSCSLFNDISFIGGSSICGVITMSACDQKNLAKDEGTMYINKVKEMALGKLVGEEVEVKGTVSVKSRDRYNRKVETMCLSGVWVNGRAIHHVWLRSDNNALVTCNQIQGNDMIKFTGIVYEYTRCNGTTSYSIALKKGSKVELVKAKYE